jgi:hypothetical protein
LLAVALGAAALPARRLRATVAAAAAFLAGLALLAAALRTHQALSVVVEEMTAQVAVARGR